MDSSFSPRKLPDARSVMASLRGALSRSSWDVIGIVLAILYALPSMGYPFARDHPVHWYIGRRLLEGEMPYASGISTKPPAVFVVHALSQLVLGDHQWSIRVFDLLFVLGVGVMIATFRTRRAVGGVPVSLPARRNGEIGAACLLVAALHYTFFDFSDTGHPELWQGLFMLLPAWIVVRAPDGRISARTAFVAGAVSCVAVLFKHPAFVSGVVVGIVIVLVALSRRNVLGAVVGAALYSAGVAAVLGLTIALFWVTGALDAFFELMVEFILNHYAAGPGEMSGPPPWLTFDHGLFAVVTSLALLVTGLGAAAASRNRREVRVGLFILVCTLAVVASVALQRRALVNHVFTYYFVVVTPALALCAAWGVRRALPRSGGKQLLAAAVLLAGFFFYAPSGTHNRNWSYRVEWEGRLAILRGERLQTEHDAAYYNSPLDAYVRQQGVARLILGMKRAGDTLCVDGFVPILYHLTDTRCPSRFFVGDGAYTGPARWQGEYENTLLDSPPNFYVTFSDRPGRIQGLVRRGYRRHDVHDGHNPHYVVLERPR